MKIKHVLCSNCIINGTFSSKKKRYKKTRKKLFAKQTFFFTCNRNISLKLSPLKINYKNNIQKVIEKEKLPSSIYKTK